MSPILPLPPFGLVVEAYQKEKIILKNPIYLFVGKNAFEEAKRNKEFGVLCLCLPTDKSIEHFRWPIQDQKIVLDDTGGMSLLGLKKMAYKLLKLGAKIVVLLSDLCPVEIFKLPHLEKDFKND